MHYFSEFDGRVGAMGGALVPEEGSGRWFVSSVIRMDARIQVPQQNNELQQEK